MAPVFYRHKLVCRTRGRVVETLYKEFAQREMPISSRRFPAPRVVDYGHSANTERCAHYRKALSSLQMRGSSQMNSVICLRHQIPSCSFFKFSGALEGIIGFPNAVAPIHNHVAKRRNIPVFHRASRLLPKARNDN